MCYDVILEGMKCAGAVMTETEKRMHRVCFTGHRPEKLTRSDRATKKDLEKKSDRLLLTG